MSPGELVRALRRRWYVLIVAAVLAAAGAVHVLRPTQTYLSTAIVVLKPPVTDTQPNQLANLQPPLAAVSYAAVQQLDSPEGAEELRAAGVRGTYRLIPRNSGTSVTPRYLIPSLQIQAEQAEAAAADAAVRKIIEIYTKHLTDLQTQQGVPDSARMSVTLLVPPTAAVQTGNKSRGLAGAALLGGVGGVVGALWTDRLLTRRSRRRQRHEAAADAGPVVRAEEPERAALAGATR
ncbi:MULTISPECIES: Wzz/FepE/Etk N-terminal domain-containing protein [unclassified Streptomyces]|uniref:Wzz/FepE/Etk N-terminal domain-containing protein n=1 Tax=unclassified Streptomyces TaxID=2593676 RepID=UPI002E29DC6F|nr:Wzz/FepE/Etk N-terminal domain-containing protein [Streptomyces sp. NBC_01439]